MLGYTPAGNRGVGIARPVPLQLLTTHMAFNSRHVEKIKVNPRTWQPSVYAKA
jgi:hypothetical protein